MQSQFLVDAHQAAIAAKHIWPDYAASEAALESAWGTSALAKRANNIFGRKRWTPGPDVLELPTKEFLKGEWVTVNAFWEIFPSFTAAFVDRMSILSDDPRYEKALKAVDGPTYLIEVSKVWSTDPERAKNVQDIWTNHHTLLST